MQDKDWPGIDADRRGSSRAGRGVCAAPRRLCTRRRAVLVGLRWSRLNSKNDSNSTRLDSTRLDSTREDVREFLRSPPRFGTDAAALRFSILSPSPSSPSGMPESLRCFDRKKSFPLQRRSETAALWHRMPISAQRSSPIGLDGVLTSSHSSCSKIGKSGPPPAPNLFFARSPRLVTSTWLRKGHTTERRSRSRSRSSAYEKLSPAE